QIKFLRVYLSVDKAFQQVFAFQSNEEKNIPADNHEVIFLAKKRKKRAMIFYAEKADMPYRIF
ncbi:hypothetical protein RZS08_45895, partial [Arthrospira platensis SPKY1]|nr:hypothetical protein [Arthrospira platensis SPKY1]